MIEFFNLVSSSIASYILAFITTFLFLVLLSAFLKSLISYTFQQWFHWKRVYDQVKELSSETTKQLLTEKNDQNS